MLGFESSVAASSRSLVLGWQGSSEDDTERLSLRPVVPMGGAGIGYCTGCCRGTSGKGCSCGWSTRCGAEVSTTRSRDLDVPVRVGLVSREAEAEVTMKPLIRS